MIDARPYVDLPAYPLAIGRRLRADWFPFHYSAFNNSRMAATLTNEELGCWTRLWARSAEQDPAGTLPRDDVELAFHAGFPRDLDGWRRIKDSALYGWKLVVCLPDEEGAAPEDGVVRYGHPFLVGVLEETLRKLTESRAANARAAERSVRSRLKRIMRDQCGAHAGLTGRDDYVSAVWEFIKAKDLRLRGDHVQQAMDAVSRHLEAGRGADAEVLASIADKMRSRPRGGP